jgi:hypothetical protein
LPELNLEGIGHRPHDVSLEQITETNAGNQKRDEDRDHAARNEPQP